MTIMGYSPKTNFSLSWLYQFSTFFPYQTVFRVIFGGIGMKLESAAYKAGTLFHSISQAWAFCTSTFDRFLNLKKKSYYKKK